jgi:metal-dependent hydrolase (beta-lactamase superfamily II)
MEMERYQAMTEALARDGQANKINFEDEDELAKAIARGEDGEEEQKECGICLEYLEKGLTVISKCDHVLHKECIVMYLKTEVEM